jgi:phosphoglycerate dehydrogenase-like enzyme
MIPITDLPTLLIDHTIRPARRVALLEALRAELGEDAIASADTPDETAIELPEAVGLITKEIPEPRARSAELLEWVQVLSAGTDHVDHDLLEASGIALTNSSGIHAEPIAEQVLAYILAFERRLNDAYRQQSRWIWKRFDGTELRGKTVEIIGVGAIGTRVAEVCSALGVRVIGTKRDPASAPKVLDLCFAADELHEVIAQSDYLVICCPLTEETRKLIDWEEFRLLGDGILINVARGEIVNESALIRALQRGRIQGAASTSSRQNRYPGIRRCGTYRT